VFIAIDAGTTRTRAWLVAGRDVRAERRADTGVSRTARDRSNQALAAALAGMIAALDADAGRPVPILASGMIGSSLGLGHVPHVAGPASLDDLAAALRPVPLRGPDHRPVWIVPGVRTNTLEDDDPGGGDVMRGEETTCLGAIALGLLAPGDTLVSIGSHWKRIVSDAQGRVVGSLTSMGGELVEAIRTGTLLADAVPDRWPDALPEAAIEDGIALGARAGMPRALFEVRLAQLARVGSPADRLALVTGIVVGADLAQWPRHPSGTLVVTGARPMTEAWVQALARRGWDTVRLSLADAERAQREGLSRIGERAGVLPRGAGL
jgi:2-dehydro-3-deoxygalactonokinase